MAASSASITTSTNAGTCLRSGSSGDSWSTARDSSTDTSRTSSYLRPRAEKTATTFNVYRAYTAFDTSSIPDTDVVWGATLNFKVQSAAQGSSTCHVVPASSATASGGSLATGDFPRLLNTTSLGSISTGSCTSAGAWVSIDIDPRYVNTMGTTKLALITSRDKDNDALTSNADHSFLFSTATAAASAAPYLQVYYGSAISITTNPSSQWVLLGSSVTLSAAADFGDTYKWQYSDTSGSFWNDIAGSSGSSNSSNYTFTTTSGDDRRMYRCVFEDVAGEEPAQGTSAATIRLYYGEKSSVVDRGFEGRQDGDAIDSTIWTNYNTGLSTREYDTGIVKQGSVSLRLKSSTSADNLYGAMTPITLSGDSSEIRFWIYNDTTTHRRLIYETPTTGSSTTASVFYINFSASGNVETVTYRSASGYYVGPTVNQLTTYTTGWYQYRVVMDFTNQTYTLSRRQEIGDAWVGLKTSNAPNYNIPFCCSATVSSTRYMMTRVATSGLVQLDDIRYAGSAISESFAAVPSVITNPSSSSVPYGSGYVLQCSGGTYPSPNYQWQYSSDGGSNWNDLTGQISETATVTALDTNHGYQYRCYLTNTHGGVATSAATLTVSLPFSATVSGTSAVLSGYPSGAPIYRSLTSGVTSAGTFVTSGTTTYVDTPGQGLWYYRAVAGSMSSTEYSVAVPSSAYAHSTSIPLPEWGLSTSAEGRYWVRVPSGILYNCDNPDYSDIKFEDASGSTIPLLSRSVTKVTSNRATSYSISNKILVKDGVVYFTYNRVRNLGGNLVSGSTVVQGVGVVVKYDPETSEYSETVFDNLVTDNHGGFNLWFDGSGRLNAAGGGHNDYASHFRAVSPGSTQMELIDGDLGDYILSGGTHGLTYPCVMPGSGDTAFGVWSRSVDVFHGFELGWTYFDGSAWSEPQGAMRAWVEDDNVHGLRYANSAVKASDGRVYIFGHNYNFTRTAGGGGYYLYTDDPQSPTPTWKRAGGVTVAAPAVITDCTKIGNYSADTSDTRMVQAGADTSGNVYVVIAEAVDGDRPGMVDTYRINSSGATLMGTVNLSGYPGFAATPDITACVVDSKIVVTFNDDNWSLSTSDMRVMMSSDWGATWSEPTLIADKSEAVAASTLPRNGYGGDPLTFPLPVGYQVGSVSQWANHYIEFVNLTTGLAVSPLMACGLEVWGLLSGAVETSGNSVVAKYGNQYSLPTENPALDSSLKGLWYFNNPSSGITTLDYDDKSSSSADLSLSGTAYKTAGTPAFGVDTYSSGNGYFTFSGAATNWSTGPVSVFMLLRPNSHTGNDQYFFTNKDLRNPSTGETLKGIQVYYDESENAIAVQLDDGDSEATLSTGTDHNLFDGDFHSIHFTRNGNTGKIYVDGELKATSTGMPTGDLSNPSSYGAIAAPVYSNTGVMRDTSLHADIDVALVELGTNTVSDSAAKLLSESLLSPWTAVQASNTLSAQSTVGAVVADRVSEQSEVDAVVKQVGSTSGDIGAVVKSPSTITDVVQAVVKATPLTTADLSSVVEATSTLTAPLGAVVRLAGTETSEVDAIVESTQTSSAGLSSIVRASEALQATLGALVGSSSQQTSSIGAVVKATGTEESTVDCVVEATEIETASIDAVVSQLDSRQVTFPVDAFVLSTYSTSTSIDSIVRPLVVVRMTLTRRVSAIVKSAGAQQAELAADVLATQSIESGIDCFVVDRVVGPTASLDAMVINEYWVTHEVSAIVKVPGLYGSMGGSQGSEYTAGGSVEHNGGVLGGSVTKPT